MVVRLLALLKFLLDCVLLGVSMTTRGTELSHQLNATGKTGLNKTCQGQFARPG